MQNSVNVRLRQLALFVVGGLISVPLFAQSDLPPVSLSQLTRPNGWQLVGSVATGSDGTALKTQPGNTLLTGGREPLTLATPTADFRLHFEVLMTANADAFLSLPNGETISLDHSRDLARFQKAPGLWQTIDLWYKTDGVGGKPVLEKLMFNGITIKEGQTLTGKTDHPVTIMAQNGQVVIRNVGYRVMSPRNVAQWSGPLSYTIYEGQNSSRAELTNRKVLKQDTASTINSLVAFGQPNRYSILFLGKLNALQAGEYQFDLQEGGYADLRIDGQEAIPVVQRELGQPTTITKNLTAGLHTIDVFFGRNWSRPGLGLFVSQVGTRPQPLHAPTSLPETSPVALISVNPDYNNPQNQTQRIRSFVQLPGEKTKRTHAMSVGSPTGMHYTVDLDQMALLQAWKGDFANVTEMWYERGEPQLLTPLGETVLLSPQTPLMVLANETTAWPDSVSETILQYKGLKIDKQGTPTMEYTLAATTVIDAVKPDGDALTRTLTLTGSPTGTLYCRLAAGTSVEEVSKGLYAINDRSYYVRVDPKAGVKMRQSNGKQELLLPVSMKNGAVSVQYSIVF